MNTPSLRKLPQFMFVHDPEIKGSLKITLVVEKCGFVEEEKEVKVDYTIYGCNLTLEVDNSEIFAGQKTFQLRLDRMGQVDEGCLEEYKNKKQFNVMARLRKLAAASQCHAYGEEEEEEEEEGEEEEEDEEEQRQREKLYSRIFQF